MGAWLWCTDSHANIVFAFVSLEQKQRNSELLLSVWASLWEVQNLGGNFHKERTRYTAMPLPTVVHK